MPEQSQDPDEFEVSLTHKDNMLYIKFTTQVQYIALDKKQACALAALIMRHVEELLA